MMWLLLCWQEIAGGRAWLVTTVLKVVGESVDHWVQTARDLGLRHGDGLGEGEWDGAHVRGWSGYTVLSHTPLTLLLLLIKI